MELTKVEHSHDYKAWLIAHSRFSQKKCHLEVRAVENNNSMRIKEVCKTGLRTCWIRKDQKTFGSINFRVLFQVWKWPHSDITPEREQFGLYSISSGIELWLSENARKLADNDNTSNKIRPMMLAVGVFDWMKFPMNSGKDVAANCVNWHGIL